MGRNNTDNLTHNANEDFAEYWAAAVDDDISGIGEASHMSDVGYGGDIATIYDIYDIGDAGDVGDVEVIPPSTSNDKLNNLLAMQPFQNENEKEEEKAESEADNEEYDNPALKTIQSKAKPITAKKEKRKPLESGKNEKRGFFRVKLSLKGKILSEDGREFPCTIISMSPKDVAIIASEKMEAQQKIVGYIEEIGRIEGKVTRQFDSGFSAILTLSQRRINQLVDQLTWIANRDLPSMQDSRSHERFKPHHPKEIKCVTAEGMQLECQVEDVSMSGIALRNSTKLPIGTMLIAGTVNCEVVRETHAGFAVKFLSVPSEHMLSQFL